MSFEVINFVFSEWAVCCPYNFAKSLSHPMVVEGLAGPFTCTTLFP